MEKAFKVKKDSKLYNNYFISKTEREKFKQLANSFFDSIGYYGSYTLTHRLMIDSIESFFDELCKTPTQNGFYKFKAKSPTQKQWEQEVVDKVNMEACNCNDFWYFDCLMRGKYNLWDYNGEVYGYLESDYELKLTEDMEEIKMSEYYRIIEEIENVNQKLADL